MFQPGYLHALRDCVVAGVLFLAPSAVLAQDSTMMTHDSAMMGDGDKAMMDHGDTMAGHDSAMAPNMMFMGAENHHAAGDYEIVEVKGKQQLKFTDDFSVDQAPDLRVILSAGDIPDAAALDLGKLKKVKGGQSYDLPKGTDLSKYTRLLVWSKKTNQTVASAELHGAGKGMMDKMGKDEMDKMEKDK